MQNVPPPARTESLRVRLIRGETADSATLQELPEVLAMSLGGEVDRARASKVHEALLRHWRDGLIKLQDTARTQTVAIPLLVGTFEQFTGQPNRQINRHRLGPTLQCKVYALEATQLKKVKSLLLADSLWSMWGDRFCGAFSEGLPLVRENALDAHTHVPFKTFKKFAESKFEGHLDNVQKNRKRSPYSAAFNGDGTVNRPKFIEIAISRGEWKNDGKLEEGGSTLDEAVKRMARVK